MNYRGGLLLFVFLITGFMFGSTAEAKILRPDSAGDYSSWSGAYTDANEYPNNDGDAFYNATNLVNTRQSYNLQNNSDSGTIDGLRVVVYAKANVAPAEYIKPFIRIGSNDHEGDVCTNINDTSYVKCDYYWNKNPSNNQNWAVADLNNLQAGFKTETNGTWDDAEHRVSQIYVDVNFKAETKKIKYFVTQELVAVSGSYDKGFDFAIADPVDEVRSAYIEIKGLVGPTASMTIGATVNDSAGTPGAYDKTYTVKAGGRPTSFKIEHDVTDYFKSFVTAPGGYTRYLHLNMSDNVYVLQAKLIITYTWIVPAQQTGNYPISGELTSTVFDSGVTDGATYNSIGWKGALGTGNTGKVRFQIATSNNTGGPWVFIGGNSCTNVDWYDTTSADTPTEIQCAAQNHNNQRYYRYKVQICSNDCAAAGDYTPTVQDVMISWSP
jgi:hypothetical protein